MAKSGNFNSIAFFYDPLSRLVYGKSIRNAQIHLLSFIPPEANVLIIGGGTGWIIDEVTKIHSSGLRITYVDNSSKMIERSRKRKTGRNQFTFVEATIEELLLEPKQYDAVLTPFVFDVFSQSTAKEVFFKLEQSLKSGGLWLYCDFQLTSTSKYWQKALIKLMYRFFRTTCKIEATKLPVISPYFSTYKNITHKEYCKNFISVQVFQKSMF